MSRRRTAARRVRLGFAACALLVATAASARAAACDGSVLPSGGQSLDVVGLRRSFVVRPTSQGGGKAPAPVVFALHPFGMNAQYMQTRAPIARLWPEAVVVYPDGSARDGSSLAPSWQGRAGDMGDRDLAFFDAMLSWLDERGCIDRRRVFVLGYSNGAGLAYLLACERSGGVAAIAIAAGRMGCKPSTGLPVVMSHGVMDRTIGFENALESASAWAVANRCVAPPKPSARGCSAAQGCATAPVTLCTHGGGHEYDVAFTRAAVDFFKAVPPR